MIFYRSIEVLSSFKNRLCGMSAQLSRMKDDEEVKMHII